MKIYNGFISRDDVFAIQNANGNYTTIKEPITPELIEKHLKGDITIGIYQFGKNQKVKWVCFDFDGTDLSEQLQNAKRLYLKIKDEEHIQTVLLEFSGKKGYHVWVFCEETDGVSAQEWSKEVSKDYGVHEIFPKQTDVGGGYGNLVKLPLGIHRVSGKRSVLFDENCNELSLKDSENYLETVLSYPKFVVPRVIVKERTIEKVIRSGSKTVIPPNIEELIKTGVKDGERHKTRFIITKELYHAGYTDTEILENIKKFNSNCKPPEQNNVVQRHIEKLLSNAERYLAKSVSWDNVKNDFDDKERLKKEKSYTVLKLDDFQKIDTDIRYIVDPLVPEGRLLLMGGRPDSGKSLISLYFALHIAAGVPLWKDYKVKKSKVLVIDAENDPAVIEMRRQYFSKYVDFDNLDNFSWVSATRKNVGEVLKNEVFDVVIFDSLRRFLKGDESSSEKTNEFFINILKPLKDDGKTVIVLHHFRKKSPDYSEDDVMENFRGSSDLTAMVDLVLGLSRGVEDMVGTENRKTVFDINVQRGRNRLGLPVSNFTLTVSKDDNEKSTKIEFKGFVRQIGTEEKIRNILKDILNDGKPRVRADLLPIIKERLAKEYNYVTESVETIDKVLHNMTRDGTLEKPKQGLYMFSELAQKT